MVKKLSLDSKIINKINKLLNYLPVISFIILLCSILYVKTAQSTYINLMEQMNNEMKALSLKYDMTELDRYKKELENILNKNELKSIEIYVADMEKGNINLDTDKRNFKLLYQTVDPKREKGMKLLKNSTSLPSKDILDKDGNIIHYQYYVKYYPIYKMEFVALISGTLGFISLLAIIIIKFKNN